MDVDEPKVKKDKKDKKDKKEKKEKKSKDDEATETNGDAKKEKKEKKDKKKKKSKTEEPQENGAAPKTESADANEAADEDAEGGKADRHIVFVGNLPYTATVATITAHFASLSPISVRCLTKREDPSQCRGIAFVEFGKVWHMRTCLDKFHHSMFNDGVSPERKINVELTAGGGGSTQQRKDKIKQKNMKLDDNRAKRIERERVAKEESRANGTSKPKEQQAEQQDYIHPSRRARVPGQKW
jgi:nucleolar protein 6